MSSTTPTRSLRENLEPADGDEGPKYKERLDEKAKSNKNPDDGKKEPSVIEKVAEKIPCAPSLLRGKKDDEKEKQQPKREELPGPPDRPHHDEQIEEFVRDQHRSKNKGGVLE
ncbi:hypothetical protein MKZ38_008949 [Zalerion maritima]|uniref:Uncharacterized protein n=1 Tax=Zalerion maritima TaxID=339359 RepID=A0AAD5RTR2_9PEZI|nr:hypothetical protein MKZ38_008949 [Zalerion maritima]